MLGRLRRLAASQAVGRSPLWESSRADFTPTDGTCCAPSECAKRACVDRISLSAEEYEALRRDPLMFVVAPGHQIASIEQLVAQNERFACVRKFHPEPSKSAREHDPRKEAEIGERPPADACA